MPLQITPKKKKKHFLLSITRTKKRLSHSKLFFLIQFIYVNVYLKYHWSVLYSLIYINISITKYSVIVSHGEHRMLPPQHLVIYWELNHLFQDFTGQKYQNCMVRCRQIWMLSVCIIVSKMVCKYGHWNISYPRPS